VLSLVGVNPDSGSTDPAAAVTWLGTEVIALLRPKVAYRDRFVCVSCVQGLRLAILPTW